MIVLSLDSDVDVEKGCLKHKTLLFRFIMTKHDKVFNLVNLLIDMFGGGIHISSDIDMSFMNRFGFSMPKSTLFTYILNK